MTKELYPYKLNKETIRNDLPVIRNCGQSRGPTLHAKQLVVHAFHNSIMLRCLYSTILVSRGNAVNIKII
jgi:hypothetical protein